MERPSPFILKKLLAHYVFLAYLRVKWLRVKWRRRCSIVVSYLKARFPKVHYGFRLVTELTPSLCYGTSST